MRSTSRWNRTVVAVALAAVMVVGTGIARADSMMTPATRDSAGQGVDASALDGRWTFTVTQLTGKPAQVIVRATDKVTGEYYWAGAGHPVEGKSFQTYASLPSGAYELRAFLWGGPPHDNASLTLSVDTP